MKIVAIIGSPRKRGNTFKTVSEIEENLKSLNNDVDFEYVFLRDKKILPCNGCYVCVEHGEAKCPLKDDVEEIRQKLISADGVILSSPVYSLNMSSLLKSFIERIPFMAHRPVLFNKYLMVVVTAGGDGVNATIESLSKFEAWGLSLAAKVGILTPPVPLPQKLILINQKIIKQESNKFYWAIKDKKQFSPSLSSIITYRIFKQLLSNEERARKYFPADYRFWLEKGWLKKQTNYYTNVPIPIYKKITSWFITSTIARLPI